MQVFGGSWGSTLALAYAEVLPWLCGAVDVCAATGRARAPLCLEDPFLYGARGVFALVLDRPARPLTFVAAVYRRNTPRG